MSMNLKTFINYDRFEVHKTGRKVHIWRKHERYLTKDEVIKARYNKEQMKLKVS